MIIFSFFHLAGKAGGSQIQRCQGIVVKRYDFTLGALALTRSGFCNVRVDAEWIRRMDTIKTRIQTFIVENFLFGTENGLKEDTSFLDEGIIDSTGVLELVGFIENEFAIQVLDEELIPENLDSIDNVVAYLECKTE